jgi:hypothetical protein
MKLDDVTRSYFTVTENFLGEISLLIKPIRRKKQKVHVIFLCDYFLVNDEKRQSIFSRSTTRKIFSLLNSQYINHEGRSKVLEAIRSLGEHICIDCIRHYQNPQQLKDNLGLAIHLPKGHFPKPGLIFFPNYFFYLNHCLLISGLARVNQHWELQ